MNNTILVTKADKKPRRAPRILIVDDDVDSALLIESVFSQLGCQTVCSLSSLEAKREICTHRADVIILDWVLDRQTDANRVVSQCVDVFSKFGGWQGRRPRIITYSSLDESEIESLEGRYFEHLDHWKKPINQRDLLLRVLTVLKKIGR